ncbi:hypothetical protein D9M72_466820 [compost metagenome]
MLDNGLHHFQGQLDRDGEADALGATGLGEDRGVDADQVAAGVDQGAAGVAGVDRGVGLDEVFVGVQAQLVAAGGADNAHGHGLADTEGVADGERDIADADVVRAAEGDGRQILEVDLQHRQVGLRVAANQARQGFPSVLEGDHDLIGAGSDVVVGQQVAFRAHDHCRTQAGFHAPLTGQVVAEEAAELRVLEQRVGRLGHHLGGVEVGHGRRSVGHGVGIGVRALAREVELGRFLQMYFLAGHACPFRVLLNDQQCHEHADNQGPADKSQGLEHRGRILRVAGGRGAP